MCVCEFIQPLEEIAEGGKEHLVQWHFEVMGKTIVPELPLKGSCCNAGLCVMPLDIIHGNVTSFHEYMACYTRHLLQSVCSSTIIGGT